MTPDPILTMSYDFCARVARRHAKNFYPSFLLLPRDLRSSMCALYAFMRQTDDIADEPGPADGRVRALDIWRHDLDAAIEGHHGEWQGWPALADSIGRHSIPVRHLHEVIDGVAMDLNPIVFATYNELRVYCHHVASAVGLCCIHIWGFRPEGGRAESMAKSCGIALQLTNIIRDVGEDARNGRVYLPEEDLEQFGVTRSDLLGESANGRLKRLLAFQSQRAYEEYDRATPLAGLIDPVGRPVLLTISGIYRALLDAIVKRDYEVLSQRVSVPGWRKASIAAGAFVRRFDPRDVSEMEARSIR